MQRLDHADGETKPDREIQENNEVATNEYNLQCNNYNS